MCAIYYHYRVCIAWKWLHGNGCHLEKDSVLVKDVFWLSRMLPFQHKHNRQIFAFVLRCALMVEQDDSSEMSLSLLLL